VAIVQLGKAARRRASAEAGHPAEGHVFFVGFLAWYTFQLPVRHADKLAEVPLPDRLGSGAIAIRQAQDPLGRVVAVAHRSIRVKGVRAVGFPPVRSSIHLTVGPVGPPELGRHAFFPAFFAGWPCCSHQASRRPSLLRRSEVRPVRNQSPCLGLSTALTRRVPEWATSQVLV
jgi:hypothetical protein